MKYHKIILIILMYTFSIKYCNSQNIVWTLQKCIDSGLENSIALKIQKLEVKRTENSRISMLNELLPTVGLFGSQSYNFGSTIDPSTNGRVSSNIQYDNFYVNAQMNLIDFGAIANSQKSKIGIEIAKAEKEIIENEYKLQILESFYQAFFTQELLEIQTQQLANTEFNLTRITKEIEIGSKPKSDLYDIKFAFAREEKQLIETQQLFEMQKIQLFQLLNFDKIVVENIRLENNFIDVKNSTMAISNPKIKVAQLAYESARKELNVQRSRNLPALSTFYQLSSFYYKPLNNNEEVDNFSNQLGNNKNQQVGLQLFVPVFNGFKNNKAIISAKIESEKSKVKIEEENQRITNQIELENKNQKNYLVIQEKLDEVLQFAKASFKTTQAKFTSGSVDSFSFSTAKNNLLTSEYDALKNKLQSQYTTHKINLICTNEL